MPFPTEIQNPLLVYDNNKGFWRRLFRRDQAAIRALRRLSDTDQENHLKIYQCFAENRPKDTQESYKVYTAIKTYLNKTDFSGVPGVIDTLHSAKLLNPEILDKLTPLKGNHFRLLENLLYQLKDSQLLTPKNFDDLAKYFVAIEENILEELGIIVSAVEILNCHCLNQENFNTILEKPKISANIASALIVLDQAKLLTDDNRNKLLNVENQFLLESEAYSIVWPALETYLPTLSNINEKQSILDCIIDLAKQESPVEKIKEYIGKLNAESEMPRARAYTGDKKFSTVPNRSSRHNSLENLVDEPLKKRLGTL